MHVTIGIYGVHVLGGRKGRAGLEQHAKPQARQRVVHTISARTKEPLVFVEAWFFLQSTYLYTGFSV